MAIIPRPPQSVFTNGGSGTLDLTSEANLIYDMQKIVLAGQEYAYFDWEGISKWIQIDKFEGLQLFPIKTHESHLMPKEGQWIYFKELLYPRKGFPFPEVLFMVNVLKRTTITFLQSILTPWLSLSVVSFLILPWFIKKKILNNFLSRYHEFTHTILGPYRLEERYRMAPAKELDKWISAFLVNLGLVNPRYKPSLGFAFGMIIEYDSAYTLRFQDIMSEANKASFLKNPSKEFGRLLRIFATREPRLHLNRKIGVVVLGLRLLFFLPRIRRAFIKATEQVDFSKLALTEADRYECLFLDQYDFLGRTHEDRWTELEKLHGGKVPEGTVVVGTMTP